MKSFTRLIAIFLTAGCVHQANAVLAFSMAPPVSYLFMALGGLNIVNGANMLGSPGAGGLGAIVLVLGVVTLDEKTQQTRFQALTTQSLSAMGISNDEALAYNSELALINLAFEETSHQIRASWKGEAPSIAPLQAVGLWEQNAADAGVSPLALAAVQKIAKGFQH